MQGIIFLYFSLAVAVTVTVTFASNELPEEDVISKNIPVKIFVARHENDSDQPGVGVASGNGIQGENYGFFGSFNFFFGPKQPEGDHHHPHPPATFSTTTATTSGGGTCPNAYPNSAYCITGDTCSAGSDCFQDELCCKPYSYYSYSCCVSAIRPGYYTTYYPGLKKVK